MKRFALIAGVLGLALIGLAVNSTADHDRRKNCEDRLVGNLYLCQGVDRIGNQYDFELLFSAGNETSFFVDFFDSFNQTESESIQGACGCQVEESRKRRRFYGGGPRFDQSDDFICALHSFFDPTNATIEEFERGLKLGLLNIESLALIGEAKRKRIKDGQLLSTFHNSTAEGVETLQLFYECKRDLF